VPFVTPPGPAPLRYRDAVFANVTKTSNLVYGSAENLSHQVITLEMDEYKPTGDTAAHRPAIIWVHGGSFCCGDKTSPEIVDEATTFAKKGYINFSINYRLEPNGCTSITTECLEAIREAREDAQTAVRFLRSHASTYKLDATRIAIAGTSAGAITALNVGYSTSENPGAAVRAAVSLSGANLLTSVTAGDAPALLFHGTSDPLVNYQWAVNTVNRATSLGLYAFLQTWPGEGHVPYVQHRQQILEMTSNFLYWELDAAHAGRS